MHTTTWSTVAVCALLALPACGPTETRARPNEGDAGLAGATDAVAVDAASDRDLGGAPSPDAAAPPACVPAPETCDGQDQDCDGRVDEAPIAASGALFSPSAAEPVGLAWAGDIWAVVQPGFPNWVFWLSFEGPTLWSTARFGAFPVDASVAMHRTGLVLAWTSAAHDLRYARLPEGGGAGTPKTVVDWAAPADALPRRPVIAADEDTLGLAFVEGEDLWFGRLDAAAGLFVGAPSRVATAPAISDLALVNEGEFGYALAWRNGDALSLARYDLTGALALAPTVVLTEDGLGPFALGANPYVSQFALLRTAGAAVLFQRFSQRGAPLGEAVALETTAPGAVPLGVFRSEAEYGVFYTVASPEGPMLRAALVSRDGEILAAPFTLGGPAARFSVGRAGSVFGAVWRSENALRVVSSPLRCLPMDE
jgi:hypothetical protein